MEEKSRILKKANDDQSRPISFNESFGGSENQLRLLLKYLPDESFKDINLILNNTNHDLLEKNKINVLSTEVLNPKYTIVKSILLATDKKPAVNIEWRVYTKNPDKPLIRDLIIEGLSLARTQKEEFASVIETNNGDVTKLFITLKEFVAK